MKSKPISWYLSTLTPEQEGYILTGIMRPGAYLESETAGPCLVGTVRQGRPDEVTRTPWFDPQWTDKLAANLGVFLIDLLHGNEKTYFRHSRTYHTEAAYDHLCHKYGTDRTNQMIRNRIIANQAKRQGLALEPMEEPCLSGSKNPS